MPTITSETLTTPAWIVDPASITRGPGYSIDWANVSTTNADGKKILASGTPVGTLLGSGKISPRVATTNPAIGINEYTIVQGAEQDAINGTSVILGGVVYENLLPTATGGPPKTIATAIKTELNAAGTGFSFFTYSDSRAS